uniref:Uncharacterized protein LOC102807525 n=1 Tax=Saccoglossus kowalevskii TaxID=10224 RepID=A0ABM0MAH7_SACKO
HQLGRSMVVDPRNVFEEADIVMVLVDVSNKWTRFKLDSDIIMTLNSYPNVKSLLVLNKIDTVQKKNLLLSITAQLTEGIVNGKSFEIDAVIAKRLGSVESGSSMKADYVSVMHKMINRLEKDRKRKLELEKISQSGIDKRRIEAIVEQWKKRQELQDSDGQPNEVISHDKSTEIKDLWMQNFSTKKTNQMSPSVDSKLNRGEDMVGYESQGLFTGEAVLEDKTQKQASVIVKSGDRLSESHENVRDTEHSNMGGEMFDENTDCKLHDSFADESVDCKDANDFQGVEAILRHSDLSDDVLRSKGLSDKDLKWIKHQLKLEQKRRTKKQLLRKTGWPNFDGVFMISALFNDGIDDLQDYLFTQARPGEWEYHPDLFTDQGPETVIYEIVRSKLLEYLPEEVPYQLEQ